MPTSFKLSIALIITSVVLATLYGAVESVPLWVGEVSGTMMFVGIVVGLWGLYRKFRSSQSSLQLEEDKETTLTNILRERLEQIKLQKEIEKLKADD